MEDDIAVSTPTEGNTQRGDHHVGNVGPIIDELLCFFVNKLDVMPLDMIKKLCLDFYDEAAIETSKNLLFDVCSRSGLSIHTRRKKHRGNNKNNMDVDDIAKVLHELETCDFPVFVAKDLNKLPPLTYNNFDFSRMILDIEALKNEVAIIKTVTGSQHELGDNARSLRSSDMPMTSHTSRDTTAGDKLDRESSPMPDDQTLVKQVSYDNVTSDVYTTSDNQASTESPVDDVGDDISDLIALANIQQGRIPGNSDTVWNNRREQLLDRRESCVQPSHQPQRLPREQQRDTQRTRTKQQPLKNSRAQTSDDVIIGTASSSRLRPAARTNRAVSTGKQRRVIGVFVTRMHANTTIRDVNEHVYQETGLQVKSEKLITKYNTYSSFLIRCSDGIRRTLCNASVWRKGIMIKQYLE
jgi:hypothetical protein